MNDHEQEDIGNFLSAQPENSHFLPAGVKSYKGGMDVVRKLILDRLQDLGLNMAEVSKQLGRNETYLQQFLKRGSPKELHERERILLAEILRVSENELRGPSTPLPKRSYEKKTGRSAQGLIAGNATPAYTSLTPDKLVPSADLFGASMDLPIFGTAQGGQDGALILSDRAVDWQARPAVLLRVLDGYGMIVSGDSMSPEHKSGSVALVNPHLPPRVGDSCVFRSGEQPDGTRLAMIKEYRGETETDWKVRQHTPPKDFKIKKSEWQEVHRTVGNYAP